MWANVLQHIKSPGPKKPGLLKINPFFPPNGSIRAQILSDPDAGGDPPPGQPSKRFRSRGKDGAFLFYINKNVFVRQIRITLQMLI